MVAVLAIGCSDSAASKSGDAAGKPSAAPVLTKEGGTGKKKAKDPKAFNGPDGVAP